MSSAETTEHAEYSGKKVPTVILLSATLGKFVETIGKWGALFMLPLVFITVWDVLQRKTLTFIGNWMLNNEMIAARDWMYGTLLEFLPFRSTLLQELEWHFHVCLYTLVLGYGYVYNRHVRVDLVREKLTFKKQAWIELIGCTCFMIPYCLLVAWFAIDYAHEAFSSNEQSASLVGRSNRWAIKSILVFGLIVAALGGIAVWLQTAYALFSKNKINFALYTIEREDEKIEKRMMLENIDGSLTDGSNEAKRGDSSKLMSRQIADDVFEQTQVTKGQKLFYYLGLSTMIIIVILVFHTFNFWSWLV